jgi:hypothetical protein
VKAFGPAKDDQSLYLGTYNQANIQSRLFLCYKTDHKKVKTSVDNELNLGLEGRVFESPLISTVEVGLKPFLI